MNFTQKTLTTLEFDKICEMLADCAPTAGAQALARKLTPSSDAIEVLRRQRRTTDARRLLETKGMPPFGTVIDVSDACTCCMNEEFYSHRAMNGVRGTMLSVICMDKGE